MHKLKRRKTNKKRKTYKGGSSAPEHGTSASQHDVNLLISEKIFKKLELRVTDKIKREYSTFISKLHPELIDSIIRSFRNDSPEKLKKILIDNDLGYESKEGFIINPPPVLQ
jgi:hypothetical protein